MRRYIEKYVEHSAQIPAMVGAGSIPEENEKDNKTIKLTDF